MYVAEKEVLKMRLHSRKMATRASSEVRESAGCDVWLTELTLKRARNAKSKRRELANGPGCGIAWRSVAGDGGN